MNLNVSVCSTQRDLSVSSLTYLENDREFIVALNNEDGYHLETCEPTRNLTNFLRSQGPQNLGTRNVVVYGPKSDGRFTVGFPKKPINSPSISKVGLISLVLLLLAPLANAIGPPPTGTTAPSATPSSLPSLHPSLLPTHLPTFNPSSLPTNLPTRSPTSHPSTPQPTTSQPTSLPLTVIPTTSSPSTSSCPVALPDIPKLSSCLPVQSTLCDTFSASCEILQETPSQNRPIYRPSLGACQYNPGAQLITYFQGSLWSVPYLEGGITLYPFGQRVNIKEEVIQKIVRENLKIQFSINSTNPCLQIKIVKIG